MRFSVAQKKESCVGLNVDCGSEFAFNAGDFCRKLLQASPLSRFPEHNHTAVAFRDPESHAANPAAQTSQYPEPACFNVNPLGNVLLQSTLVLIVFKALMTTMSATAETAILPRRPSGFVVAVHALHRADFSLGGFCFDVYGLDASAKL